MWTRRLAVLGLLALMGRGLVEAGGSAATALENSFSFLPQGYFQRFQSGSVQGLWGAGSFGFRRFPLPLASDVRLTLGRVPGGLEAGVEGGAQDTRFAAGVFEPYAGADETLPRVPRFQVVHAPAAGPQAGVSIQGAGYVSETHLGYAMTAAGGNLRLLAELGYGFQGSVRSPFVHLESSAARGGALGPFGWNAGAVARAYAFPGAAQESLDLSGSLNWRPFAEQNLSFTVTHFDRLVWGIAALPDFNLGPDRVTVLSAGYWAPPQIGVLRFRGLWYSYARHWLSPASDGAPLSATVGLDFGGSWLDLTPRYDFVTGEQGLGAAYYYRFGALAAGPRVDVRQVGGVISWGVGLAVASN